MEQFIASLPAWIVPAVMIVMIVLRVAAEGMTQVGNYLISIGKESGSLLVKIAHIVGQVLYYLGLIVGWFGVGTPKAAKK
jgi:hypothetical protein